MSRIACTGVGVVASPGAGREAFWKGLLAGGRGPGKLPGGPLRSGTPDLGFTAAEFDPKQFIAAAALRRHDRSGILGVTAAKLAITDASLKIALDRIAIVCGAGGAGVDTTSGFHRRLVETAGTDPNPMAFPNTVPNAAAGQIAIATGITGYNTTVVQSGAAGEEAIALAADLLLAGRCDAALAGGVDELAPVIHYALARLRALSRTGCRPFDAGADGTVLAEDAAFVVLEREDDARKRGAKILAILSGHGRASFPSRPLSYAPVSSAAAAMRDALSHAGVSDVAWANSPANGVPAADAHAAAAISEVCPKAAVSSIAGACGESLAIGAVRAAASVCALAEHLIPPCTGLARPRASLNFAREPLPLAGHVLQHGAGPGGADVCLIWSPA